MKKSQCPEIDCFVPSMSARSRWEVIGALVDSLAEAGLVTDRERALGDVLRRERTIGTGMTRGIAIPHARTAGAARRCIAVGCVPGGMDFGSLDGLPTRIVVLMLSPLSSSGPHLACLAGIAAHFSGDGSVERLLGARTLQEAREVLKV